jgi:phage baseplate assembly protein W
MANDVIYSDFKASFDVHPIKQDLVLSVEEVAVKTAIKNIVFTAPYERYRKPTFGAGIPQDLFSLITPETEYEVQQRISMAIANFEPRAVLKGVKCVATPDKNGYDVTIIFTVVNKTQPITLNQILRRVR